MPIHHATRARAEKNGITLTEIEMNGAFVTEAVWAEQNRIVKHADPKMASAVAILDKALVLEYPGLVIAAKDDYFLVMARDEGDGFVIVTEIRAAEDANLDAILETAQEMGVDPEQGPETEEEDGEERPSYSIVKPKYRREYKERGNPNHCGDWIAEYLTGRFSDQTGDGPEVFNPDLFLTFLRANGVDTTGKWAQGSPIDRSWKGRMRMNGRQKLDVAIAISGRIVNLDGSVVTPPADVVEALRSKHAKAVNKAVREREAAERAVRESVEGVEAA